MPSYDPELTSGDPYYDDFDKTKNYLKILFKARIRPFNSKRTHSTPNRSPNTD